MRRPLLIGSSGAPVTRPQALRLLSLVVLAFVVTPACRSATPFRPQALAPEAHARNWVGRLDRLGRVADFAAVVKAPTADAAPSLLLEDGVSLEEAETLTLLFHPDLRVARLEARVPLLGAQHAGIAEDPSLDLDLLRIVQSVASPWVLATALKFTVPVAGRLQAERAAALSDAQTAVLEAHVLEVAAIATLREAWNEWVATTEQIALLERHMGDLDAVLSVATAQQQAEQIDASDLRVLELERVSREGEVMALRQTTEAQVLGLKALMGLAPQADIMLIPAPASDSAWGDIASDRTALRSHHVALRLAAQRHRAANAALRLELRKAQPDFEVGALLESEEDLDRIGAGLSMPLPLWNKNRRAIAEACAAREAAKGAHEAQVETLVAALVAARRATQAADERTTWLMERVAPLADQQVADLRRLGELGEMDTLVFKDALTTVLETQLSLLEARAARAQAAAKRRGLIEPLRVPTQAAPLQGAAR